MNVIYGEFRETSPFSSIATSIARELLTILSDKDVEIIFGNKDKIDDCPTAVGIGIKDV